MKKILLFFLLIAGFTGGMKAQEVIIGTETTSDYDIAFYPYYMDSYWESLYLPSEIGMPGLITSVALQTGAGPGLQCEDVRIYIGTRNTTLYSSTSDWTPSSNLTLVYSGTNVTLGGSNGWENYTLQTPYMYDGNGTLVVVFAKHASNYSMDATYYYHSTDNYSSLYKYMDEDPTYAQYSASSTGSRAFYRPNLKLTLTPDSTYCGAVNNIQVSGITTNQATISWNTPFNPHSYIVEVKTAAQGWDNPNMMSYTTNDTFYTVTGLNPSTVYTVRVANDCVEDTSSYTTATFNTQCGPMSALPLMENFDSYTHTENEQTGNNNLPNCWDYVNTGSSYSAYPYVYYSTSSSNSGNYSLRFYTGTGTNYSDQYAFLPALDTQVLNIQSLTLGFSVRRQGNSGTFRLVVGVTEGTDLSTFTVIDTIVSSSATYAYHEVPLSGYAGSGNRIVLKAPKLSSNNRGHVDDIVLGTDLCATPSNLTVNASDVSSVTLQWTENGTASSWVIEYGPVGFTSGAGTTVAATSNPFDVTGLNPATIYEFQVRADCGGSYSEWSLTRVTGTTTCVPLTTIPFSENFDSYTHTSNPNNGTGTTNIPICWDTYNSGSSYPAYPYVYYSTSNSYSGNYSLRFYTSTGTNYANEYAILPAFDNSIPLNTLQVSMKARSNSANTPFTLVVGEMSGGPSSFVAIDTLVITGTGYAAYVAYLDTYTGTGNRIALKAPKLSSNNRGNVDDIVVNYLSNCRIVSDVTVSNVTTTSATISWQSHGSETAWLVEYRIDGDTVWQPLTATVNPYLLSGLTAATTYQVRVSADCGTEISEASANVSFTTVTCDTTDQCVYTFNLEDSFGDGWNNASLRVLQGGQTVNTMTVSSNNEYSASYQVALCDNIPAILQWVSGNYDSECSFEVVDPFGEVIYTASDPSAGTITTLTISCTPPTCPRPSSVSVSNIEDVSASVSWVSTGTETAWNIEYKPVGTATWTSVPVTTNPYTLTGLTALTQYDLRVQADCGGGDVSDWRETAFQTAGCSLADLCAFTFNLTDSYGDGWNNATMSVQQNGLTIATLGLDDDYSATEALSLCDNMTITLVWNSGTFDDECSFTVSDPFGEVIYTVSAPSAGTLTTFTAHCTPPTCPRPASVTVSNIGTTSATVGWVSSGTETAWNIEYKPVSSSTWMTEPVTTNPYTLTGLTATTMYDLRVQADCGGGDVSDWRETTFNTNLCEAYEQCVYTLYVTGEYSDSWDYSSLTVMQNGIPVATITSVGYTATVPVSLCNGVSTSLVYSSGYYDDECSVTLTGPDGTQLFSQADMSYYTTYTFTPDCGLAPEPCMTPTGLAVNNVTQNAAVATWTAGGTETSWNVQYKAASATTWQSATTSSTSYTMSGLTANTPYQVRVQADCGDTESDWTTAVSFTTQGGGGSDPCNVPTGLTASDVQGESITVTWNNDVAVSSWNIQYRPEGGQLSTATSTVNSYTITGLTGNTSYQIQVQANCGNGNLSDWSQAITVTTTGIDNWLSNSVILYPNPANNVIHVQCSLQHAKEGGELYLFDVYGKLLQVVLITDETTAINVSGLANGMYFVRVVTEEGMVTKTFVKR